eukprot:COSAG01_NODE_2090_length_8453_cov_554.144721_3_plen_200_part_00
MMGSRLSARLKGTSTPSAPDAIDDLVSKIDDDSLRIDETVNDSQFAQEVSTKVNADPAMLSAIQDLYATTQTQFDRVTARMSATIELVAASIAAGTDPPDFTDELQGPMLMLDTYLKQVPSVFKGAPAAAGQLHATLATLAAREVAAMQLREQLRAPKLHHLRHLVLGPRAPRTPPPRAARAAWGAELPQPIPAPSWQP